MQLAVALASGVLLVGIALLRWGEGCHNEEVPGGAMIKHVYHDRVVLDRSGSLENLIFEETRSIGIESQALRQEPQPTPTPSYNTNNSMQNFNQQQTQQIKDRLSRLRNRLQNDRP